MSLVAEQELMWGLSIDREVIQEFCQRNQIPEEEGPFGLCYDLDLFSEAFKRAPVDYKEEFYNEDLERMVEGFSPQERLGFMHINYDEFGVCKKYAFRIFEIWKAQADLYESALLRAMGGSDS
jgi:hypothetical protein